MYITNMCPPCGLRSETSSAPAKPLCGPPWSRPSILPREDHSPYVLCSVYFFTVHP